jgi:hypothetical protein
MCMQAFIYIDAHIKYTAYIWSQLAVAHIQITLPDLDNILSQYFGH